LAKIPRSSERIVTMGVLFFPTQTFILKECFGQKGFNEELSSNKMRVLSKLHVLLAWKSYMFPTTYLGGLGRTNNFLCIPYCLPRLS